MLHCGRSVVILGMSLSTFTVVHVVLSLVGIASGVLVLLRPSASPKAWGLTTLFLATTLAASVTGLLYLLAFPRVRLGHGHRRRLTAGLRADPAGALSPSAGRPVARDLRRRRGDPALSQRLHRRHAGLRQDRLPARAAGDEHGLAAVPRASARARRSRVAGLPRIRPAFSPARPPRARPGRGAQSPCASPIAGADRPWGVATASARRSRRRFISAAVRCRMVDSSSLLISVMALVAMFGGGMIGIFAARILPGHHLSASSASAVKLLAAVVVSLTSLVLALMLSSANNSFARQCGNREETQLRPHSPGSPAADVRAGSERGAREPARLHDQQERRIVSGVGRVGANRSRDVRSTGQRFSIPSCRWRPPTAGTRRWSSRRSPSRPASTPSDGCCGKIPAPRFPRNSSSC